MSRRKVEMILELVDRATRPARRFIALQRRMGAAVERANRIATRTARTAGRATDLYKRAIQGLGRAQDALQRGIRRSNDLIRRQVTQMRMATGMMRGGVMGMGRAALLAGGMFTAYAGSVSLVGTAMLGPARQFEKFQTILTTTEGTAEAAQEAMGWVQDFAVSTPFELEQVMGAFVQLRSYGLDPTNGLLRKIDLAFQGRVPMRLFFDLVGFEIGVFLIERLRIKRQKTSPSGRVVRIELEVELVESATSLGGLLGAAAGIARAITNPILRRG